MNRMRDDGSCSCDPNITHGTNCLIIAEFRRTPEQNRELYREILRKRQAEREGETATDIPYRLQKLGIPTDAILPLTKNPTPTASIRAAKEFSTAGRDLARTLVLAGPRGAGKTVGAVAVFWNWAKGYDFNGQASGGRQLPPAVWCHAAELTAAVDFGRVNPDWLEGLKRAQLLAVDDLGKDSTSIGAAALRDVLTYRHEKHRATVITSNLSPSDLLERFGESWFERLKVAALVPDLRAEKSLRSPTRSSA